jgi:hypothetical protein
VRERESESEREKERERERERERVSEREREKGREREREKARARERESEREGRQLMIYSTKLWRKGEGLSTQVVSVSWVKDARARQPLPERSAIRNSNQLSALQACHSFLWSRITRFV